MLQSGANYNTIYNEKKFSYLTHILFVPKANKEVEN